jgi:ferritin-like metal-binding protein YciE
MKLLKDLFLDELADMYDAEQRIVIALPKLAQAATDPGLKTAFLAHLDQTRHHVTNLEQVFRLFDEPAKRKTCEATVGLLKEGDQLAADFKDSPAINAALISAAQRVEHYEMAAYGCLHEWAGLLGHAEAAGILEGNLNEEKAANTTLSRLARGGNNQAAEFIHHEPDAENRRMDRAAALV